MWSEIRPAVVTFIALSVVTGIVYPAVVTGVGKAVFPDKAEGSLLMKDGKPAGSRLIAQAFTEPKYFWPRPSAANYDASAASGSNLGPSNPALAEAVAGRVKAIDGGASNGAVPVDLVTASASGLDPHISPAAAELQIARVARARGMDEAAVRKLVADRTAGRTLGLIGEPRVNVLELNLSLDQHPVTAKGLELGFRAQAFLPTTH